METFTLTVLTLMLFPVFASVCVGFLIWDRTKTREWITEIHEQAYKPLVTTIDYIIHRDGEMAAKAAMARDKNVVDLEILKDTLRRVQQNETPRPAPEGFDSITLDDGRVLDIVTPDNL